MSHVPYQPYKCCLRFNNIATIIFRQNVRYFTTERDEGRYVNITSTGRVDGRYVTFHATARDDDRSIQKNNRTTSFQTREMKVFRQMWREQMVILLVSTTIQRNAMCYFIIFRLVFSHAHVTCKSFKLHRQWLSMNVVSQIFVLTFCSPLCFLCVAKLCT